MLGAVCDSAERAGRDPIAITPCFIQVCLIGRDEATLAEILEAPLVKAFLLQISAETLRGFGYEHPMGENWRGFQDIDPARLTRERIVDFLCRVDPEADPRGRAARHTATGRRDHQDVRRRGPAGAEDLGLWRDGRTAVCGARPPTNVREAEDELMRLCGDVT